MSANITIYKIKDFVRVTETGQLDLESSKQLIREIATAHAFHADHNILIDLRDTTVAIGSMSDLLELARYMASYKSLFRNKLANVVPDNEDRLVMARRFKACLDIEGFTYKFFTDIEAAIEWLSYTSPQN